jgi:DNA-binding GntR family transcriptional regulator
MLKKISLSEQAYHILAAKIISGEYPGGTRLVEEELTREFGISRTPVRDALRRLEGEELIEPLPKRGYQVRSLDNDAIAELYGCRARIELLALESAIGRIPAQELKALKAELQSDDSLDNSLAVDEEFHFLIARCCDNRYLSQILEKLIRQTAPFRTHRNYKTRPEELKAERIAVIDSLLTGDYQAAAALLEQHIVKGKVR